MVAVAVAAIIALVWCFASLRIGPAAGFVDQPGVDELKTHRMPAVPLGGVGVFVGVHSGLALTGSFDTGLFAATLVVLVLGLGDDRFQLSPLLRLGVETGAGVLLVTTANTGLDPGSLLHLVAGTVLVVVSINAVNLFDGLDGLVGSATVVLGLGLAWLASARGIDADFGLILAAGVGGFLVLNWYEAKVFLGDNGAYTVGVFIAYGMMVTSTSGVGREFLAGSVLLGVFALDLVAAVIRRGVARTPMFGGYRDHLYDQLHARGMSVPAVAVTAAGVQALFVLASVGLDAVTDQAVFAIALVALVIFWLIVLAAGGFLKPGTD